MSAYRQLRQSEKLYVDGYVSALETDAARNNERISLSLYRVIPDDVVSASRGMLDKPLVRAAITERINTLASESELTVHRVIKELMGISFSSIAHYMDIADDGFITWDFAKATPEQLAAVKSYEVEEGPRGGRKVKITLHDKLSAIDKLGRYMGILQDDNPHWRSDNMRPVGPTALPGDITVDGAADEYARLINI